MAFKSLVAAYLLASLPTALQVAPSSCSTLVMFDDSLSDAGWFLGPVGPAGSTSRFTNRVGPTYQNGNDEIFGPTVSMLLGNQLGIAPGDLAASTSPVNAQQGIADGNDWAVDDHRTNQVYDSIIAANGSLIERGNTLLRSRGGHLVDRTRQGLGADPNALCYTTGGSNGFLQGRILNDVQAQQTAGHLADSTQALQQVGARYIMAQLSSDLGLTLATSGDPLQPFASQLSDTFNAELTAQLNQAGANVIPLNTPLLLKEGMTNPASFGPAVDQNLISTCFSGNGCTMNPTYGINGSTPDPSKLLFDDSMHPTITSQRPIADYTYSLLSAPWELTLLSEMARDALHAYQDELRSQQQVDQENWQNVGRWRGSTGGGGQRLDFDSQGGVAGGDGNGYNLTPGDSYRIDEAWHVGITAGFYQQKLEAGTKDPDHRANNYTTGAFVQYQESRWWANAALTGSYLDYDDLKHKLTLGGGKHSKKDDASSYLWVFSVRLGYDIAQQADSPWHLSLFVSADYTRVEVDGYSRKSASAIALDYNGQKRSSRRLGVGLQGRYVFGSDTQLFAEYAHEREYGGDTQSLTVPLNSLPGSRFTLEGYTPQDHLNHASPGSSQKLVPELSPRGGYNWHKGENDTQQSVSLVLSLDF